jgi:formylglycine-generating enzyme required for sulfatase activity
MEEERRLIMKHCVNCGKQIPKDATFCDRCGHQQPVFDHHQSPASQYGFDKGASVALALLDSERSQLQIRPKHVVVGLIGVAVIAGAIWYFLPSATKQGTRGTEQFAAAKPPKKTPEPVIPKPGPAAGAVMVNPRDGLKYVWIPPGTFMMGCSPCDDECYYTEKPSHQVTITKGFWLGQTPVTVGAYKRFAKATGRPSVPEFAWWPDPGWGYDPTPLVNFTRDEAQAYCSWVGGRLPTEAEWEYAARGGSTESRYGNLDDIAWYADNSGKHRLESTRMSKEDEWVSRLAQNRNGLHDVGLKQANGFGLFDMLGNVLE